MGSSHALAAARTLLTIAAAAVMTLGAAQIASADPLPGIDPNAPAIIEYQDRVSALVGEFNESNPADRIDSATQLIEQITAANNQLQKELQASR